MKRLTFVWVNLAALAVAVNDKGVALAQAAASLPQQIVNQFYANSHGPYPGYRANHAKGIVCEGMFTPSAVPAGNTAASTFFNIISAVSRA